MTYQLSHKSVRFHVPKHTVTYLKKNQPFQQLDFQLYRILFNSSFFRVLGIFLVGPIIHSKQLSLEALIPDLHFLTGILAKDDDYPISYTSWWFQPI